MLEYWLERFPLRLFAPLAVAIAAPAQIGGSSTLLQLALDAGFALLLLAQFRLWDDLADRHTDAFHHPTRVLVRSRTPHRYMVICAVLCAATIVVAERRNGTTVALPLLLALSARLAALYSSERRRTAASDLIRLAKYPAFVLIVAAGRSEGLTGAAQVGAGAAFLAAGAYEVWHDPATPLRALTRSSR